MGWRFSDKLKPFEPAKVKVTNHHKVYDNMHRDNRDNGSIPPEQPHPKQGQG
jgi:hypothetical protein